MRSSSLCSLPRRPAMRRRPMLDRFSVIASCVALSFITVFASGTAHAQVTSTVPYFEIDGDFGSQLGEFKVNDLPPLIQADDVTDGGYLALKQANVGSAATVYHGGRPRQKIERPRPLAAVRHRCDQVVHLWSSASPVRGCGGPRRPYRGFAAAIVNSVAHAGLRRRGRVRAASACRS
jgi:hypothetical protein